MQGTLDACETFATSLEGMILADFDASTDRGRRLRSALILGAQATLRRAGIVLSAASITIRKIVSSLRRRRLQETPATTTSGSKVTVSFNVVLPDNISRSKFKSVVDSSDFQDDLKGDLRREVDTARFASPSATIGGQLTETATGSGAKLGISPEPEAASQDQTFLVVIVGAVAVLVVGCYLRPCGRSGTVEVSFDPEHKFDKFTTIEMNGEATDIPDYSVGASSSGQTWTQDGAYGETAIQEEQDAMWTKFLSSLQSTGFFENKEDGSQLTGDAYDARYEQARTLYQKNVSPKLEEADKDSSSSSSDAGWRVSIHIAGGQPQGGDSDSDDGSEFSSSDDKGSQD